MSNRILRLSSDDTGVIKVVSNYILAAFETDVRGTLI